MPMADSCQCKAKPITVLKSNYPPIKTNKLKTTTTTTKYQQDETQGEQKHHYQESFIQE